MKYKSLVFCLLCFAPNLRASFREDVIAKSAQSLKSKRAVFCLVQGTKQRGSALYEKSFQALIEETVDFCEIVCDGATKYHEKK